jgi:hypothetical protein
VPLTPNFSAAQPLGTPAIIQVTDTSTGSDGAVTQRRVYLRDSAGNNVLPEGTSTDYVQWAYADTSIDIDCLTKDYALKLTVQWLNVSNVVLYDKEQILGFTSFNEDFAYSLTQMLTANPLRVNDSGFLQNFSNLRNYIDSGNQALERQSDMFSAQRCYDAGTKIRTKSGYLFNIVS